MLHDLLLTPTGGSCCVFVPMVLAVAVGYLFCSVGVTFLVPACALLKKCGSNQGGWVLCPVPRIQSITNRAGSSASPGSGGVLKGKGVED